MKKNPLSLLSRVAGSAWTIPLAIIGLSVLTYGLFLTRHGFYWDDWAKIAVNRLFGPDGYWAYYAEDRPLSAWTHIVFNALLGETPFAWQMFQFGLSTASALGVYALLGLLWPQARWQAAAAALIFVVYPVFQQHPIAVTFHQQWLQYLLYLLSLCAMLLSVLHPRRYWPLTLLALALSAVQLTVTEYFAPLELLRPVLIWVVLAGQPVAVGQQSDRPLRRRALRTLVLSAPYLALTLAYIVYRLFFLRLSGDDPYRAETFYALLQSPLPTLVKLAAVIAQDSAYTLVSAWTRLLVTGRVDDLNRFSLYAIGLGVAAGTMAVAYLWKLRAAQADPPHTLRGWIGQALLVGGCAFVLGILPAWITGREVVFDFHSDRYALPGLLGASLLIVTFVTWLTDSRFRRSLLLAVLIGVAVISQVQTGYAYQQEWEHQMRYFWQLYWRAPYIRPGTAIVTYEQPFPNQGLFSTSAALNLLFPHTTDSAYLRYWWYALSPRYTVENLPDLRGLHFETKFRNLKFWGGSQNSLVLYNNPFHTDCMWVVTAEDQDEAALDDLVKAAAPITDLNLIEPRAPLAEEWRPPETLFGPEPPHEWCYFFEKSDLAAQLGDWKTAAALADTAIEAGYTPQEPGSDVPREWQPFISAYAHLGRWDDAGELALQAAEGRWEHLPAYCNLWNSLTTSLPHGPEDENVILQVNDGLHCSP